MRLCTLVLCAGCASLMTVAPPIPADPSAPVSVGDGASAALAQDAAGGGGTLWFARPQGRATDIGLVLFGGVLSQDSFHLPLAGGGGIWRHRFNDPASPRYIGVHIEGGALWAKVGLPIAPPMGAHWSVYTQPSVSTSSLGWGSLPVGLQWNGPHSGLFVEVGGHVSLAFLSTASLGYVYRR